MFTKSRLALAAFFVAVLTLIPLSASASVGKISVNPDTASISLGQTATAVFTLNAPIICPQQSVNCDVTLSFTTPQSLGVSESTTTLNWAANQWSEVRMIQFTLVSNTQASYPQPVVYRAVAQSDSVYYQGFAVSVTLNLDVPDTRPTPSPIPTSETLANTGSSGGEIGLAAVLVILSGTVLIATAARKKINRRGAARN